MKLFKLTFITALTSCLFFSAANAQKLYLGIKAGVNMDKTSGDHLEGDFNGYFLGGAYVGVKFTAIRIQGELLFTQSSITAGDNFKDAFGNYVKNVPSTIKNGSYKSSDLSIPITVGFNVVPKLLWVYAGPQYTGVVSTDNVDDFYDDSKDILKKGYVSGVIGADVSLPFHLNAGARYIFGLSDRNNTNIGDSWKTHQIQLHVGFTILEL